MQKYTKVKSTAKTVQELEIHENSVIVNIGIKEIHEVGTEEAHFSGFDGWEIAERIIYSKDEYIKVISEKNASLEGETTNLQIALTEVYEQMIGK
jgi:hypothetical protein